MYLSSPTGCVKRPTEAILQQAQVAGISLAEAMSAEWRSTLAINKREYDGDLLQHRAVTPGTSGRERTRNDCVMVYLHSHAKSSATTTLLALVTSHLIFPDGRVQSLVRVLPSTCMFFFAKMACTMVKGWQSYADLAHDLEGTTVEIVPASRIHVSAVVAMCERDAVKPNKKKHGNGPWLAVREFR